MRRLSKKKKIELLEGAKETLLNHTTSYICRAVERASGVAKQNPITTEFNIYYNDVFKYIPELLKYKPKKLYSNFEEVWFHPTQTKKRVDIIDKTVMDIRNSIKK